MPSDYVIVQEAGQDIAINLNHVTRVKFHAAKSVDGEQFYAYVTQPSVSDLTLSGDAAHWLREAIKQREWIPADDPVG